MTRRGRRLCAVASGLVTLTVLTSCGGSQDGAAVAAAEDLVSAIGEQRGGEACALLAPAARSDLEDTSGQPCSRAVLGEEVGTTPAATGVDVFDTMAQVRFADDTIFLSRFDGAWLVVAAACTARATGPYDCGIQAS